MTLYKNALVFSETEGFIKGGFAVENGVFSRVFSGETAEDGIDLAGKKVLPGLADIHIHGAAGSDFSDGDEAGLRKMGEYLASCGVTSFLPASMTLPYEKLERAFETAETYQNDPPAKGARLAGVRMEGPYLSREKRGAQNGTYLKLPDIDGFAALTALYPGLVRMIDVAPELPGAEKFIGKAAACCRVSLGHTAASYGQASAGFSAGASHVTHLFNAMAGLHHREPGVIGAASERENVTAELISDGFHVHPAAVRAAFKLFPGRLCLVSDALRCLGAPDGAYTLGGQSVFLKNGEARLEDGTIAGSVTDLYTAMRRAVSFGVPEREAVNAVTALPARILGLENTLGAIREGLKADFVVADEALKREAVYLGGVRI